MKASIVSLCLLLIPVPVQSQSIRASATHAVGEVTQFQPLSMEVHESVDHTLIGVLMIAMGIDMTTTMYCTGARLCEEANPLLRPLQDTPVGFGLVKTSVAVAQAALSLKYHARHRSVRWITILSIGFYSWVIIHNTRQIIRATS